VIVTHVLTEHLADPKWEDSFVTVNLDGEETDVKISLDTVIWSRFHAKTMHNVSTSSKTISACVQKERMAKSVKMHQTVVLVTHVLMEVFAMIVALQ
jgi:hypothetical protein